MCRLAALQFSHLSRVTSSIPLSGYPTYIQTYDSEVRTYSTPVGTVAIPLIPSSLVVYAYISHPLVLCIHTSGSCSRKNVGPGDKQRARYSCDCYRLLCSRVPGQRVSRIRENGLDPSRTARNPASSRLFVPRNACAVLEGLLAVGSAYHAL